MLNSVTLTLTKIFKINIFLMNLLQRIAQSVAGSENLASTHTAPAVELVLF